MTWVVKGWRAEGLERLLADEARDAVRAARDAADRDGRRARRAADRTAADAAAQLEALERLGVELRETVKRARASSGAAELRAEPPPLFPARRARPGRASMRS